MPDLYMLCNGPINNENESAKRWQTAACTRRRKIVSRSFCKSGIFASQIGSAIGHRREQAEMNQIALVRNGKDQMHTKDAGTCTTQ